MKFKTVKTSEDTILLVEISTAKEMYKFECATYIENNDHYDNSDFTIFKDNNDISCNILSYEYISNDVIVSILFYKKTHLVDKDIAKIQDYLLKKTM